MVSRPTLAFSQRDAAATTEPSVPGSSSPATGLVDVQASLIGGAIHAMDRSEVRSVLEELSGRLDTAAHRLLAELRSDAMVDFGDYLQDVAKAVISALSCASEVRLRRACKRGCFVPLQRALPLGLIVVELVTNAVKYAHPTGIPGTVTVACRRARGGAIIIEVSDDGVGLPENLDPMKDGNLGLKLVHSLAAQLGARISFTSSALGLSVALQMPVEGAA